MPTPNNTPPSRLDNQISCGPAYTLSLARTRPSATSALKPIIATPMASSHMRMRVQSPMLTMSATAPMVQKCVRCATAPKATASAKLAHST